MDRAPRYFRLTAPWHVSEERAIALHDFADARESNENRITRSVAQGQSPAAAAAASSGFRARACGGAV
jgi:hypothetical protein